MEAVTPQAVWWLSFSDSTKGFMGCAIIKANDRDAAVAKAKEVGIHPGGDDTEVTRIDPAGIDVKTFKENTLITRAQLDANHYRSVKTCSHIRL